MSFFKNLFKQPPIEQRKLNLGKLTAKVTLKNGEILYYKFEGEYRCSEYFECFSVKKWLDFYDTAREAFDYWKKNIGKSKFFTTDPNILLPISDIAKIELEEQEYFITTDRKY